MTTLPACPDCEDGRVTVQYRAVRATDVSPSDSEREESCERCDGKGTLDEIQCHECQTWHAAGEDAAKHFCEPSNADTYLCEICRPWSEGLHSRACEAIHEAEVAEAAGDARCDR